MSQTFVVTGANRGLGLETCRQLVERGDRVIATARDPDASEELRGLDLRVERLDVADAASVKSFARAIEGEGIDVLFNNAGMGVGRSGFEEQDWDELEQPFRVNAVGPMRVTQALLPHLRAGTAKRVVNVSSRMGSIADNTSGGAYAYRASKAALNALTKSLAQDLAGEGFTCIAVHPGWVRTRMGGESAPLSTEESIRGLLGVVDGLKPSDTGRFLAFDGEELPW